MVMWSTKKNNGLADGSIDWHENKHYCWAFAAQHLRFEKFSVFEM